MTIATIKRLINQIANNGMKRNKDFAYMVCYADGKKQEVMTETAGNIYPMLRVLADDKDKYLTMMDAIIGKAVEDREKLALFCEAVKQANDFIARQREGTGAHDKQL